MFGFIMKSAGTIQRHRSFAQRVAILWTAPTNVPTAFRLFAIFHCRGERRLPGRGIGSTP